MSEYYEIEGVKYLRGSAGSLILACPKCGEEHFRDPDSYMWSAEEREANDELKNRGLGKCEFDKCYTCGTRMEPVRIDELQTRWIPFWESIDRGTASEGAIDS